MAQLPMLAKAATPILRVILKTWCSVVIHSADNDSLEKISEKLRLEKKTFDRWRTGENIATFENLNEAANHALELKLIPQELNQLLLEVYKGFFNNPDGRVDYWKMIQAVNSLEEFISNKAEPQLLINQLDELGHLVYGPGQDSPEFGSWLERYKPFFIACEDQNLNEYIKILALREFVEHKELYSSKKLDPDYEPKNNDLKKIIDILDGERQEIKKIIKDDIVDLIARIAEKSSKKFTYGEIAFFAGQHYSMGKFLADGEIIPHPGVYRLLELMAGFTLEQQMGIKKLSPFSLGRIGI